jgi:multisubunit Na+/H+ antiporter MnhC subunit
MVVLAIVIGGSMLVCMSMIVWEAVKHTRLFQKKEKE